MIRIAITGPSGSGKGYICRILKEFGIECLDCDAVVHRLYASDDFAERLSSVVLKDVRHRGGGVDRKALAPLVFGNSELMKRVQELVYPLVRARCLAFLEERAQSGAQVAVVDAPQLFEAHFEGDYDLIVAVSAPEEERLFRIMERDGISKEDALLRMSSQLSDEEYAKRSDAVIRNGAKDDPEKQLKQLLARYGVVR
ncbi:MAG: dephospho-CoA kinase [Clostridia bacterium]|nr:dephospho-CoA kinase [Clostridia bacterium]